MHAAAVVMPMGAAASPHQAAVSGRGWDATGEIPGHPRLQQVVSTSAVRESVAKTSRVKAMLHGVSGKVWQYGTI